MLIHSLKQKYQGAHCQRSSVHPTFPFPVLVTGAAWRRSLTHNIHQLPIVRMSTEHQVWQRARRPRPPPPRPPPRQQRRLSMHAVAEEASANERPTLGTKDPRLAAPKKEERPNLQSCCVNCEKDGFGIWKLKFTLRIVDATGVDADEVYMLEGCCFIPSHGCKLVLAPACAPLSPPIWQIFSQEAWQIP